MRVYERGELNPHVWRAGCTRSRGNRRFQVQIMSVETEVLEVARQEFDEAYVHYESARAGSGSHLGYPVFLGSGASNASFS